jgi:hypothetical protein
MATSSVARRFVRPPSLRLLPHPGHPRGIALSTVLHVIAMAAIIWLPRLFPSPTVLPMKNIMEPDVAEPEPLVIPALPRLEDRGAGSRESAGRAKAPGSAPAKPVAEPEPRKPDFIAPQEIVSVVPNAVNRVQTIRRPDLVAPPKMKFPIRLQSMVVLPSGPAPVLTPVPPEPPKPVPMPTASVEVPVLKPVTPAPVLVAVPKRASVIPAPSKPTPAVAPNLRVLADTQANLPKSVVVINAVNVAPDPGVVVPDAELAGNFVVGPPSDASSTEKPSAAGAGHAGEGSPGSSTHGGASRPESGSGTGSGAGHTPGAGSGDHAEPGTGTGTGRGTANGIGSGSTAGSGGRSGAGGGSGSGSTSGPGSGNGSPGTSAGSGPSTGISISGGIPGRNGATVTRAVPQHRSYGMLIISGGNNGGASRDVGVFDRSETVYSVTVPVAGGPDWTIQYAVLNRNQAGAGFLTPPFVGKKIAATMPKSEVAADSNPVFITGIIDESGKLHTLRPVHPQDPRSQYAIRALEQWEFLPAQMDGKPIACKVLIGVSITLNQ